MGDFERGLIQGEAMRHQIEKTNIDLLAENTKLKARLVEIAEQPTSDEMPEAERDRATFKAAFDWTVLRARDVLT
jgi:hypothetical protein